MDTAKRTFMADCILTALFFGTLTSIGIVLETLAPGLGVVFISAAAAARYWPTKGE
jgi:hypothetical protein